MPVRKIVKRVPKVAKAAESEIEPLADSEVAPWPKRRETKILIFAVMAILAIAGLGYFFKDKFLVALVEGKPIFRYQLNQRLMGVYGKDTLENIIVEELIQDEAKRKAVVISGDDINKELDKLEKSLGAGMKLEDALKLQGVSLAEFKKQLELRLQVNRILEKEISVSPEEIDKYIKDNAKTMVATTEAERKIEAESQLKEQKINERIQSWISELLKKAKISRFLK